MAPSIKMEASWK
ncbi:hypothetical protein IEO21_09583 [Rhodonia placenta]|uniref:Uncharacterized protein n=1 Tax=Rhodonia placenta TaxID=104341 RepID=A0A8H7NU59_9APHY|nr:hypothetical protein IEO21_09583 [Postia placenta]